MARSTPPRRKPPQPPRPGGGPTKLSPLAAHWRLGAAITVAAIAYGLGGLAPAVSPHRLLVSWDIGALSYVMLLWILFLRADEAAIRDRASRVDERAGVIVLVVLAAIAASLGGIVAALIDARDHPERKLSTTLLVAATLAIGWALLQSIFVPHYAHRHFAMISRNPKAGFGFPGEPPHGYMDFVYLSFTIGATFQVSDTSVGCTPLRNLVTAHAAAAYVYNTAILAVGINLVASFVTG